MFGLYMLWAALLASTSRHLAECCGQAKLARLLATAIVVGAVLAALISLLKPWLVIAGWDVFPPRQGGTIGQSNHFSTYLWLGIASALYLRSTAVIANRTFWIVVSLLTLTSVFVGQRSAFVYAAALIGIAVWQGHGVAVGSLAEARRRAWGVGLLFLLLQPLPQVLPPFDTSGNAPPPALRAVQQITGPSIRLQLMGLGIEGVKTAPWLGNGIGSYPTLALTHANKVSSDSNPGSAEHAHNLPVDIASELGLPAALMIVLAAAVWFWRLPHRADVAQQPWVAAMIGLLCLHSLIEYPLWHSYFLGLLALVAGAWGAGKPVGRKLTSSALVIGLVAWGGLSLVELRRDYRLLEIALALGKQPATMPLAQAALLRIPHTSLMSPWVNTIACVSLDPLKVPIDDGLAVCRIAMTFAPTIESGVNMVVLQWRNGNTAGARKLLYQLNTVSLRDSNGINALLASLVARDARLSDL
jgi:O-antigen ligase